MADKKNNEGLREFEQKMHSNQKQLENENSSDKGRKPDQQNRLKDLETRLP